MDYQMSPTKRTPIDPAKSPLSDVAFVLSIIGIFCTPVPFFGFFGPALAIILANLGRGKEMQFVKKGKAAFIIGIIGLILAAAILAFEIYEFILSIQGGSFEATMENFMELLLQVEGR
ncbi:MAG: hypothetical protein IJM91_03430 [Lachnospiraceae bacterium]|nr:hypothetical protein [Lachnospiraceae bacterium]